MKGGQPLVFFVSYGNLSSVGSPTVHFIRERVIVVKVSLLAYDGTPGHPIEDSLHCQIVDYGNRQYLREQGYILTNAGLSAKVIAAVADGVSAPYAEGSNEFPLRYYDFKDDVITGGALVAQLVTRGISEFAQHVCLEQAVINANKSVRAVLRNYFLHRFTIDDAGTLPGAAFAAVKAGDSEVEIVQCGDSLAFIELKNGNLFVTPNGNEVSDQDFVTKFARCLSYANGDRNLAWQAHVPTVVATRRANTNVQGSPLAYCCLNGQEAVASMLYSRVFPRTDVRCVLLVTDGMLPDLLVCPQDKLARTVMETIDEGGLAALHERAIRLEQRHVPAHVGGITEKTAVLIAFD